MGKVQGAAACRGPQVPGKMNKFPAIVKIRTSGHRSPDILSLIRGVEGKERVGSSRDGIGNGKEWIGKGRQGKR